MNTNEFIIDKLKSTKRKGIDKLIKYLESTDFFIAPASTRYHGCWEGGLAEHSINVYDALVDIDKNLYEVYGMPKEPEDSIILVSLLHDLNKIDLYNKVTKWRKDENGKWESYIGYERDNKLSLGHGSKSIYLATKFIELTDREAEAIHCHMGPYDISEYNSLNDLSKAYTHNTLAYKLFSADMMATYCLENELIEWETKNPE